MSTMMGDWLGRNLFDQIPEGVPALDPEEDDEDGSEEFSTQTFAPPGFDTETSVAIVALPSEGQSLPGPASEEKHCTLLYLGHIGGDGAPDLGDYKGLLMNVVNIAAKERQPFKAEIKEIAPLGDEGAQVMHLSSPEMVAIRNDLLEIDSEVNSLLVDGTFTKYPEFLPHVTIGYGDDVATEDVEEASQIEAIEFDRLALWFGDQRTEFPFTVPEED